MVRKEHGAQAPRVEESSKFVTLDKMRAHAYFRVRFGVRAEPSILHVLCAARCGVRHRHHLSSF